jgi:hypothetical protein
MKGFERTLGWIQVYVDYAYFCATTSLKFDKGTKGIVVSKSRAHFIRHVLTMGLVFAEKVAVILSLGRDVRYGDFGFDDKFDILHIGITTITLYCFGSHFNNIWKSREIVSMLNSFLLFYKDFTGEYSWTIIKIKSSCTSYPDQQTLGLGSKPNCELLIVHMGRVIAP